MTAVDPYVYPKIPRAFAEDPEVLAWFQFNNRWAHDMWRRTGGGDDDVANQQIQELYPWKAGIENKDEINFSPVQFLRGENKQFIITTTVDYTTAGSDIIICNNSSDITITLNDAPDGNEVVSIIRAGIGGVTISGGTRNINDAISYTQILQYESNDFPYSVETDQWYIL